MIGLHGGCLAHWMSSCKSPGQVICKEKTATATAAAAATTATTIYTNSSNTFIALPPMWELFK